MPYWAPAFVTMVGMLIHRKKLDGAGPVVWAGLFGLFYGITQMTGWL